MTDARKQRAFIDDYVKHFNVSRAAKTAGVTSTTGYAWMKNPEIAAAIDERLAEVHMSADEALKLLAEIARGDMGQFIKIDKSGGFEIDLQKAKEQTKLVKRVKKKVGYKGDVTYDVELYSALEAIDKVLRVHGKFNDKLELAGGVEIIVKKIGIDMDKL